MFGFLSDVFGRRWQTAHEGGDGGAGYPSQRPCKRAGTDLYALVLCIQQHPKQQKIQTTIFTREQAGTTNFSSQGPRGGIIVVARSVLPKELARLAFLGGSWRSACATHEIERHKTNGGEAKEEGNTAKRKKTEGQERRGEERGKGESDEGGGAAAGAGAGKVGERSEEERVGGPRAQTPTRRTPKPLASVGRSGRPAFRRHPFLRAVRSLRPMFVGKAASQVAFVQGSNK